MVCLFSILAGIFASLVYGVHAVIKERGVNCFNVITKALFINLACAALGLTITICTGI